MATEDSKEVVDLLREIRDLLRPVASAHDDAYQAKLAEQAAKHRAEVRAVLSTDKRRAAWALADGTKSQRQIATATALDEGGASKFFKQLRDIRALTADANPTRAVELD